MSPENRIDDSGERWPTTSIWDLLEEANTPENREKAVREVANRYWRPVYAYLRRHGRDHHSSADLAQEFFLNMVSGSWLTRADSRRGRFRVFLVTVLIRYIHDFENRRQTRFERNMPTVDVIMAESDARLLKWDESDSPEQAFWRQYARDLLDSTADAFRDAVSESDPVGYGVFTARIDADTEERSLSWEEIGRPFGLSAEEARYTFKLASVRFRELMALQLGSEGERRTEFKKAVSDLFRIACGNS